VRHSIEPRHRREHDERHDQHHLPVALGKLRPVLRDLRQSREGDVLHRLHRPRHRQLLEFLRLIEIGKDIGRIHPAHEKLGYVVIARSDQVGDQQPRAVRRHAPQRSPVIGRAGTPVAQRPEKRRFRPHRRDALPHQTPYPAPGQRHGDRHQSAREGGDKDHFGDQREAELPREDRILNHAQRVERQQQEKHRGDTRQHRHVVKPGRNGSQSHEQHIEQQRDDDVEQEYRLVIALGRRVLADERLRKTAVHHHEGQGGKNRGDGHDTEVLRHQQPQHDEAHDRLQEHGTRLFGHVPRHAAGDPIPELSPHALFAESVSTCAGSSLRSGGAASRHSIFLHRKPLRRDQSCRRRRTAGRPRRAPRSGRYSRAHP